MKSAREYISEIDICSPNMDYISKTGVINGSLLQSLEIAMKEYAIAVAKEALKNASYKFRDVDYHTRRDILDEANIPNLE